MSQCQPCNTIYNLGTFNHCGEQELPIEIPIVGSYILRFSLHNAQFNIEITTTSVNEKPSIDFSTLPMNQEMFLQVINPDNTILGFDMPINSGTPCENGTITDVCYSLFKLKSLFTKNL